MDATLIQKRSQNEILSNQAQRKCNRIFALRSPRTFTGDVRAQVPWRVSTPPLWRPLQGGSTAKGQTLSLQPERGENLRKKAEKNTTAPENAQQEEGREGTGARKQAAKGPRNERRHTTKHITENTRIGEGEGTQCRGSGGRCFWSIPKVLGTRGTS